MEKSFSCLSAACLLVRPGNAFETLAKLDPSPFGIFIKTALWLGILPPIFAYFGTVNYGWRLGTTTPIYLPENILLIISLSYFVALLFGFVSAAVVSKWMASTYGARQSLGIHFAMICIVGAPLTAASLIHLYPDIFINILVLIPAVMWSMYLLYRGLPIVLHTTPERGMLMASALIGYFLVAFVSLLGITVSVWVYGIGPSLGI